MLRSFIELLVSGVDYYARTHGLEDGRSKAQNYSPNKKDRVSDFESDGWL